MKFHSIDELTVLVECGQGGNLTTAAELLDITPAAVSSIVRKLEARLGVKVLERTTRRMSLTAEGEALMGYAERALELLREGESLATDSAKALVGTVRLGVPSALARNAVLPLVDSFLAAHPKVAVELTVSDTVQDVVRDEMDLALRYGDLKDARLLSRKVVDSARVVAASPAYWQAHGQPAHPSELTRHECVAFNVRNRRHVLWQFTQVGPSGNGKGEEVSVRVSGRRAADDSDIAHRWALAGHGVIYTHAFDLKASLASGALVAGLPGWAGDAEPLFAVLPTHRFVPLRVKAMADWLAGRLG
jgi:DNA-binding transcriptional LysR family regulator